MGEFIARQAIKLMAQTGINLFRARVNVLGITFKENCPDVRNSQVPNIVRELENHALLVSVCDHVADAAEAFAEYGISLITEPEMEPGDALILAVAHQDFLKLGTKGISKFAKPGSVVIDVKSALNVSELKDLGFKVWRL
jgi:UDP-N-acetyl-D-galactosamine dehydrogenase